MNLFGFIEYAAQNVGEAYKSMQTASGEVFNKFKVLENMEELNETSNNM